MSKSEQKYQDHKIAYRHIFKATSLFGGVQAYKILIGVIQSKCIAVLLGPAGMGVSGLYTAATSLIQGISSMSLSSSAVRDISEAYSTGDAKRINRIVTVLKRLVWITGLLGVAVTMILSPVLSKSTFGNYDYTLPFIFLSVVLLLNQLSAGQQVVLQGMRKLKYLAKSTAIGSTIGLLISVPLYYFFGLQGIVPTLILNALTMLLLTWYFSRKLPVEKVAVSNKQTFQEGKNMLKMGIAMSLSSIFVLAASYILRGYIRYEGGMDQVGFFTAGFAIVNTYVGMIFTAMGTDYYPRLAAVNKDNKKCNEIANQQGEIAVLIMAPLLLICLVFMPVAIRILYSNKFLLTSEYVEWAIMGMLFKAASWVISFQFIAKGESRLFVVNEFIANVYMLGLNLVGYNLYGLKGLGISFAISYLLYFIQVFMIARKRYDFKFTPSFNKVYSLQLVLLIACFLCVVYLSDLYVYIVGCICIMISGSLSFVGLDRRMGLKSILLNKLSKK